MGLGRGGKEVEKERERERQDSQREREGGGGGGGACQPNIYTESTPISSSHKTLAAKVQQSLVMQASSQSTYNNPRKDIASLWSSSCGSFKEPVYKHVCVLGREREGRGVCVCV